MKRREYFILIAEPDPEDQFVLRRAFEQLGIAARIFFVNNAREAIAYVDGEGQYDDRDRYPFPTFIITELKMPVLDGFYLLQHLKSNPRRAVIPTVVFSSSEDLDDIKKAYIMGASAYHLKPSQCEKVREILRILYDYWMICEVPEADLTGKQLITESRGKLGERIPQ